MSISKVIDGIIETTSFKSMKSGGKNNIAKMVEEQKTGSKNQNEAEDQKEAGSEDAMEGLPVGVPGGFPGGKPPEGIPPEVSKYYQNEAKNNDCHAEITCQCPKTPSLGDSWVENPDVITHEVSKGSKKNILGDPLFIIGGQIVPIAVQLINHLYRSTYKRLYCN